MNGTNQDPYYFNPEAEDSPAVSEVGCSDLLAKENKWQPIETAPHAEVFLAYSPHDEGGFQFVACWNTKSELVSMMTGDPLDDKQEKATHWMKLPSNPS